MGNLSETLVTAHCESAQVSAKIEAPWQSTFTTHQ